MSCDQRCWGACQAVLHAALPWLDVLAELGGVLLAGGCQVRVRAEVLGPLRSRAPGGVQPGVGVARRGACRRVMQAVQGAPPRQLRSRVQALTSTCVVVIWSWHPWDSSAF